MTLARDIVITEATPDHIEELARTMRAADVAEVRAAGMTRTGVLRKALSKSSFAKTIFVGGEIGAMWGLEGSPLKPFCRPWLLTAPPIERIKISFLRITRLEAAMMLDICPDLRGYVDARYRGAIRLLEAAGFTVGEEFPFGPSGVPFRQYTMRRSG